MEDTSKHLSINPQHEGMEKQATLDIVLLIHQFLV